MERFVSGLRNPPLRKELTSALGQGKGVFRAFKDILGRYPEAGKLWFYFKQKEMKREITRWYNGLREEWGLEKIGEEPEDTGDLVLEDFRFRPFGKEDRARAGELRRFCLDEARQILAEKGAANPAGILPGAGGPAPLPDSFFETAPDAPGAALAAESGGGEFAGYIFGTIKEKTLRIHNLEVKPEYRGLGIGEALLARLLKSLNPDEVRAVTLDLPSWMEGFSRVIERESFKPLTVRYFLNLPPGTNCY